MQEGTLYRHLLRDSWRITWKYKPLWVLGFLALFWGNVGAYNAMERVWGSLQPSLPASLPSAGATVGQVLQAATPGALATAIFLVLIFLALTMLMIWLTTCARGGLFSAVERAKEGRTLTLKTALQKGSKHFIPLLIINVLTRLDIALYALVLAPIVSGTASGGTGAQTLYFFAFFAVTLISLLLSVLGMYASGYVVIEGETLGGAIRHSLQLFGKFWLISSETALLLYLLTFALGIVALTAGFVLAVPGVLLAAVTSFLKLTLAVKLIVGFFVALYILLLLLAGSAFMTFHFTVWTLLFLRLQKHGAVAKVVRLTARFGHILHRKIV